MFISDIKTNRYAKNCIIYLAVTVFCLVFSIVYLQFSYGVSSNYMKCLALIPLVLGFLINWIVYKIKKVSFSNGVNKLYNAGILALIVGSAVQGSFDIAGAYSNFIKCYLIIRGLLYSFSSNFTDYSSNKESVLRHFLFKY